MRKLILIVAASLSIPLAACNTVPTELNTGVLSHTLTDEKALYAAEAAFKGVSLALNSAVDAGLLKGTNAAKAKTYYDGAYAALLKARELQRVGNTGSAAEQAAVVLGYAAELQRLLTS